MFKFSKKIRPSSDDKNLKMEKNSSGTYDMPENVEAEAKAHAKASRKARRQRRRRVSGIANWVGFALAAPAALFGWAFFYANSNSVAGYAGWISGDAPRLTLKCGLAEMPYNPQLKGVMVNHKDMPCGSLVKVTNLNNHKSEIARVVHTDTPSAGHHVADVTYATARDLGIDTEGNGIAKLALTPVSKNKAWWAGMLSVTVRENIPPAPSFTRKDEEALTQMIITEVEHLVNKEDQIEGVYGVGIVALNRAAIHFRGKETLHDVIYDGSHRTTGCQFSGFCDNKANPTKAHPMWKKANQMARQLLTDTMPGKQSALRIALQDATHFHAFWVSPKWAKKLHRLHDLPARLEHLFYAPKGKKILAKLANMRQPQVTYKKSTPQLAQLTRLPQPKPKKKVKTKAPMSDKANACTDMKCLVLASTN